MRLSHYIGDASSFAYCRHWTRWVIIPTTGTLPWWQCKCQDTRQFAECAEVLDHQPAGTDNLSSVDFDVDPSGGVSLWTANLCSLCGISRTVHFHTFLHELQLSGDHCLLGGPPFRSPNSMHLSNPKNRHGTNRTI